MIFRTVGIGICCVLFVLFLGPMFAGIRNIGNIAGGIVCLLCAGVLVFFPAVSAWFRNIWANDTGRIVLCVAVGLLCAAVIAAAVITGLMIRASRRPPDTEAPVVILGCKVRGTEPSLMLARRLNAAIPYLKEHPDLPVIVCGGQGKDEQISEAACMASYLTAHGIEPERIYQDAASVSTKENLRNALDILEAQEWEHSITIVTDGYHQLRASMIAKDLGLRAGAVSAKTSWYLIPTYYVREWFGVCYQVTFG